MSKENETGLGKEVLSYCGKCKQPTNHIVTTLSKRGTVDKCECQTCKAVHKYRDPDKPVKAGAKKTTKKSDALPKAVWGEAMSIAKGPSQPYKMSNEFEKGDVIDHPMFGRGIVEELISDNKIKVLFEESGKLLAHNRK